MHDTPMMKADAPLTAGDFTLREEPFSLFAEWLAEAAGSESNDPNAMALANVEEAACRTCGSCS